MRTIEEVLPRIREIIAESLGKKIDEVGPDTRMVEDRSANSIDFTDTILLIEQECGGIEIPDKDAETLKTPRLIAEYIVAHQNEAPTK